MHGNNQSIVEGGPWGNIIENNNYYAPTLTSGSVSPPTGNLTTSFTYSVDYADADNDTPAVIQVVIDGTPNDLVKQDAGDEDYTDGCTYVHTTALPGGSHQYHFLASDGGSTVRLPIAGEQAGPTVNLAPTLTAGGVSPSNGSPSTSFTFSVNYTDVNDDAPGYIRVVINGTPFDMVKQDPGDAAYADGCLYNYTSVLSAGTHTYYFEASDGEESARLPSIGEYSGPDVNSAPSLTAGGASPVNGTPATTFTFSVNYSDADNDPPTYIRVVINGTAFDMTKQNASDATYTDGCAYTHSTTLPAGSYVYHFEASDGLDPARAPSSGELLGPTVSSDGNGGGSPYLVIVVGIIAAGAGSCIAIFYFYVTRKKVGPPKIKKRFIK